MVSDNDLKSVIFSRSTNGGTTWTPQVLFNGSTPFPQAGGTPSIATDKYGNVFLAYPVLATNAVEVLLSYDGGATFHNIKTIKTQNGVPIVATGNNAVWVALQQQPQTGATGSILSGSASHLRAAQVFGLGRVKPFKAELISSVQSLVDGLAVGPAGQVSAPSTPLPATVGPQQIYLSTDPDGLGPKGFGPPNTQVTTQVGNVDVITGQSTAGITPSPSIAYDLSADPFTGRLYMAYVDAPSPESSGTVIELRFSDNNGTTWSAPVQVNDDASGNSHFAPHIAVDPVTGAVAITWYDARNDNGLPPTGGTNAFSNDDFQVYGAVGTPTADRRQLLVEFRRAAGFLQSQRRHYRRWRSVGPGRQSPPVRQPDRRHLLQQPALFRLGRQLQQHRRQRRRHARPARRLRWTHRHPGRPARRLAHSSVRSATPTASSPTPLPPGPRSLSSFTAARALPS